MVTEFAVRVDFDTRRMSLVCSDCRDALSVDLTEPGLSRVLAMFASNHSHGARPTPILREVPALAEEA
jgi:hypothetical protein